LQSPLQLKLLKRQLSQHPSSLQLTLSHSPSTHFTLEDDEFNDCIEYIQPVIADNNNNNNNNNHHHHDHHDHHHHDDKNTSFFGLSVPSIAKVKQQAAFFVLNQLTNPVVRQTHDMIRDDIATTINKYNKYGKTDWTREQIHNLVEKLNINKDNFVEKKNQLFDILGISEADLHKNCIRSTTVQSPKCPSTEWIELTKSNIFGYLCPQDLFPSVDGKSGAIDGKQVFNFSW